MAVTYDELKNGTVMRIRPSQLAKLAGESRQTVDRKIKSKQINTIEDPVTKREWVPRAVVLSYLSGQPYKHDYQNKKAIAKMEIARAGKKSA